MSLFEVDKDKCKRDGICVAVCPRRNIELRDDSPVPTPAENADERCISCGHCVAVCPQGAFSLASMKPGDCPPVRKDMALGIEQTEHFIRARRSVRVYREKEVEREKLARLIGAAHYAPTGMNSQQVNWMVIESREKVLSMAGMVADCMRHLIGQNNPIAAVAHMDEVMGAWDAGDDAITRGAPSLVVVHAPAGYQWDCMISLTSLDLAAQSFGLGTCWAGYVMIAAAAWPPLQQALSLPEGNACFGAMMVGYPKYKYHRLPLRKEAEIAWR